MEEAQAEIFVLPPQGPVHRERIAILRARKTGLYADVPGTGPAGETCGSCLHKRRMSNGGKRAWHKCRLTRERWTGGSASDIRVRTPACRKWEPIG